MIDVDTAWQEHWDAAFDDAKRRHPEFDPEEYYRSGRASKDNPDKEDPKWWAINGPKFVKSWQQWRTHAELAVWETADPDTGEIIPAIELGVWADAEVEGLAPVRSIIDRVMEKDGDLYIVDLKSGTYTDPWPLQLALNNLGLYHTYGVRAKWGGYWKARKGGVEVWHDLTRFSDTWLWEQVHAAQQIRDQQLFLANPNNLCTSACGVAQWCVAMGGTPFFRKQDATLTQVQEDSSE